MRGRDRHIRDAEQYLRQWRRRVRLNGPGGGEADDLPGNRAGPGLQVAANRRYGQVRSRQAVLGQLQSEALEMLKHARYWFSQLTLIQALCFWEIQAREWTADGQTLRIPMPS